MPTGGKITPALGLIKGFSYSRTVVKYLLKLIKIYAFVSILR